MLRLLTIAAIAIAACNAQQVPAEDQVPEVTLVNDAEEAKAGAEAQMSAYMDARAQARAKAQAQAKAQYDQTMAHMKALRDKYAQQAEDYQAQAGVAAVEEAKAAKKEHEEVSAAAAAFPFLGIELGAPDEKASKPTGIDGFDLEGKAKPDVITEALKHKEVPRMMARLEEEHKQIRKDFEKDPTAGLKHLQEQSHTKNVNDVQNMMRWRALKDGWDATEDDFKPDESKVQYKAHLMEFNIENKEHKKLSQAQKDALEEAVRVHETNNNKIAFTKKRLKVMQKLVDDEHREAKKERMEAEAEEVYDANDAMVEEIEEAKKEAHAALAFQEAANAPDATEDLVSAMQDVQAAASAVFPEN
jgi:hypothetical protein